MIDLESYKFRSATICSCKHCKQRRATEEKKTFFALLFIFLICLSILIYEIQTK